MMTADRAHALSSDIWNATLYHWKHLLRSGFSLIKLTADRDRMSGIDNSGWREPLIVQGFRGLTRCSPKLYPRHPQQLDSSLVQGRNRDVHQRIANELDGGDRHCR
jgi:hypothetical protein